MRIVDPIARRREREVRGPHRRARQRQDDVDADAAQQRALAGHVRSADDQRARMTVAEAHVVSDANPLVDQRMAERGRVEQRTGVDDRRIRIGGMFVGVGGQRRERFDIADRPQPLRDRRTVGRMPSIDADRRQLANQQQCRDWSEPHVERRLIEECHQAAGGARSGATAGCLRRRAPPAPRRDGTIRTVRSRDARADRP